MFFIGLLILVHITWNSARQIGCENRGPFCGNDGKTYTTMCQLIWAKLEDTDLAVLHDGGCHGKSLPMMMAASDGEVTGSGKLQLLKLVKNPGVNNEKIREIMPIGWPPLGPMLIKQPKKLLKAVEEQSLNEYSSVFIPII